MTKKHFIELADLIRARPHCFDNLAVLSLADFCQDQNPRFDRQRWLDYIAGRCGKNGGKVKAA